MNLLMMICCLPPCGEILALTNDRTGAEQARLNHGQGGGGLALRAAG